MTSSALMPSTKPAGSGFSRQRLGLVRNGPCCRTAAARPSPAGSSPGVAEPKPPEFRSAPGKSSRPIVPGRACPGRDRRHPRLQAADVSRDALTLSRATAAGICPTAPGAAPPRDGLVSGDRAYGRKRQNGHSHRTKPVTIRISSVFVASRMLKYDEWQPEVEVHRNRRRRGSDQVDLDDEDEIPAAAKRLRAIVAQITPEEFRWQEANYDRDSLAGRELLFLIANNEWARATSEIIDLTRSDAVDTTVKIDIDLDRTRPTRRSSAEPGVSGCRYCCCRRRPGHNDRSGCPSRTRSSP